MYYLSIFLKHYGEKKIVFYSILLGLLLCNTFKAHSAIYNLNSENSALNGYVKDSLSRETLIGASVYIKGTKLGAYTNKNGYFSLQGIKPGKYTVRVYYVGYNTVEKEFTFNKGEGVREDFLLILSDVKTQEVKVEAEKEVEKREILISKVDVPMSQIKEIRIGGESDVFRSIQMLPGILTSSQISSGLFVRGGSPDQNLVLLDGSTVYNPSHIFGFISTFNTDAIKDVELIKGGFPALYGGRLSAVLNMTQKEGNQEKVQGTAAIGIISSKLSLEGPIGNGSWCISARRTYFDLYKKAIDTDPKNPIPDFGFYDLNAKVTQNLGVNDKLSISGFLSSDNFKMDDTGVLFNVDLGNRLLASKWTHIFNDNLFSTVNVSYSRYKNNINMDISGYKGLDNNSIEDFSIKTNMEWFINQDATADFGTESIRYTFSYLQNFTGNTDNTDKGANGNTLNLSVNDWNHSVYGHLNYKLTELISVQTGLRANYWQYKDVTTLDPRLALKYQVTDDFALKAAWGIYHQNLRLASNPDFSLFDTWLPSDKTVPVSSADHYILSFESKLDESLNFNFDVYYKKMKNISEMRTTSLGGSTVADVFHIGDANSYGLEIMLQKRVGNFTGWVGYALGFINAKFDSINYGKEFRPKYDRRHDFKLVVQYKLNDKWDIGANFTFQSGQSYTGATSRFQSRFPGDNYGAGIVFTSQRYGLRLPPSHQLNVNASYSFKTFGLDSKLIFDIYNVYNHRDILMRYYDTEDESTNMKDVKLLPIIPSVSYEIHF